MSNTFGCPRCESEDVDWRDGSGICMECFLEFNSDDAEEIETEEEE